MKSGIIVSSAFSLLWSAAFGAYASDSTTKIRTTSGAAETVHVNVVPGPNASTGAKLCVVLAARKICYTASVNGKAFPLKPEWKPISADGQPEGPGYLLFTALKEPFFSRQDGHLALLVLDSGKGVLRNVLPPVVLSEQSEHSIWRANQISMLPILTTAEFHWDMEHESHFGFHQYQVNTYVSDGVGNYALKDTYLTKRQYSGLDDVPRWLS